MDDLVNTSGRVLGGLLSAGEIYHGGLMHYLANRQALLSDPSLRGSLGPFGAGLLQVGGSSVPTSAAEEQRAGLNPEQARQLGVGIVGPSPTFGGVSPTGSRFLPNLPPLGPEAEVQQQLAGSMLGLLRRPGVAEQASLHGLGITPALTLQEAAAQGLRLKGYNAQGQPFYDVAPPAQAPAYQRTGVPGLVYDPQSGKPVRVPTPPGAAAIAAEQAKQDEQARLLGFKGRTDPKYIEAIRGASGFGAPSAAPPTAAPAAAPPAPEEAGPSDDTPVGALPIGPTSQAAPQGGGPLAFLGRLLGPTEAAAAELPAATTTTAAPSRLGARAAAPAATAPPPGTRETFRFGPFTRTRSTPAAKPVPAQIQRLLVGQATAADAADQAREILRRGPQHPLSVGGIPLGTPPSLAGPVSGRALSALGRVSGQPVAVEEADLSARIAHAMSGIFTITGLRPNEQTIRMFEPLTPSIDQPTEILDMHLRRLSMFYRSWQLRETELSNLSATQRAAMASQMMTTIVDRDALNPGGW